ncbi:uncharacterized protein [Diabrotica undecimpunctata]|uniref:uncharacterized protein n=1 Tax=Diabrotica undecimpunctata TaxID=50387 RepID=UPI003B63FC8E
MRLLMLLGFILTVRAASRPLESYFRSLPSHWFRGFGSTTAASPTTPYVEINGQPSSTPAPYFANNLQSTIIPVNINNRLLSGVRSDLSDNLGYEKNVNGNLLFNGFESTTSAPPTSFIELNKESVSTPAPLENEGLQSSRTPFNLNNGLLSGLQSDSYNNQQSYGQNLQNYGQNLQSYGQNLQSYGQNLQSYGQNVNGNLLFNGFRSTTSAPPTSLVEINRESVSTPAPLENEGLQSESIPFNANSGLLSGLRSDSYNNQQSYGQNVNGNLLFNGFGSTTTAPPTSLVELNRESVSTPAPFQNEALQSTSIPFNLNNGLLSRFGSDVSNNLQSYGQNVNSNLLFNGFGSTTTGAPPTSFFELNKESVSSSPAPFQNEGLQSSNIPYNVNNELLSRFGSDISHIQQAADNNAFYSSEGSISSTTSAPFDFSRLFLQNNPSLQSSSRVIPEINTIRIQSKTSGGSIYDSFGIDDEAIESQSEKPAITKNVYFFSAPEEEAVKPRIYFEPNKKHVNVVYIKAPAAPSLGPIEITPPKQESPEKTVVYVLVKKPEEQKIIVKPGPTAKPVNPDVFFINYKDDEEAQYKLEELQSKEEVQQQNQADDLLLNAHLDINPFKRKVNDKKVRKTRQF